MKKVFFVIATLVSTTTLFAQSEKFTKAMTANLAQVDSAKSPDDFLAISASFERIGDAEKTQWLPYYYAALYETLYAFMKNDPGNNDTYADKAQSLLDKAEAVEKDNSEISCIKSMIASMHLMVDPQSRWQKYGAISSQALDKAKAQDPNNPRPYFLQAQGLRYTPEQFGGGCATAKPVLEQAIQKFETFKPASPLHPDWGKAQATQLLAGCK